MLAPSACGSRGCDSGRAGAARTARDASTATEARSPAEVRRDGNHLVGAASLYLQQHAHNPIDWYPFGPEALERARALDRPIFLSIGYASCHWCHVMEEEVFEKDDVALVLNAGFVAIKIDREERPDLDETFMRASVEMTGSGGWPNSLFITASEVPFFAATYLPHDRFLAVAESVTDKWTNARAEIDQRSVEMQRTLTQTSGMDKSASAGLSANDVRAATREALGQIDLERGGFKSRQKFPTPVRWMLLLHVARRWGDDDVKNALVVTLDAMASGGIHDHVGGGFHRYSTDQGWIVPHFEKMLYDNAQLASLYLEASAALAEPRFAGVARDVLDFLVADMQADGGGFGASFDADSGGREGAAYVFTPSEIARIAGKDGAALAALLGVHEGGPIDGGSVVTRRASVSEVAAALRVAPESVAPLWTTYRDRLRDARRARPQPRFDTKVVTAWNAMAIDALAQGSMRFGEPRYMEAAVRAAEYVWRGNLRSDGVLLRASTNGVPGSAGILDDYACLGGALLELFEATADARWLTRALSILDNARTRFAAPGGGWFLSDAGGDAPFGRGTVVDDSVEPSGNSSMLHALVRAAAITGRDDLSRDVRAALEAYAPTMRRSTLAMAGWLDAALLDAGPFYDVAVAGDDSMATTQAFAREWGALLPSWATLVRFPAAGAATDLVGLAPPTAGKRGRGGGAAAYVCPRGACQSPATDPKAMRASLLEGFMY